MRSVVNLSPRKREQESHFWVFRQENYFAFRDRTAERLLLNHKIIYGKEPQPCQQTLSGFIAYSVRHLSESIGRSWMQMQWRNGFRQMDSPARFTTWIPGLAAPIRCRSRISPQDIATRSAESISN